jgi:AcrR family transcriptional regulator
MSTSQEEPRRSRGRPRTPGAEQRIIDAALEEYGEHGWAGFTMDGVARRAGVGKSTVYLRWQDKDALLTDAVSTASGDLGAVDTGSLRGDLHALAINLFRHYRDPAGWAALRVVVDTAGSPQRLGGFVEAVTDVQAGFMGQIVARAVERGELSDDHHGPVIGQCVYGSVLAQNLTLRLDGRSLDDGEIDERASALVSLVLEGVSP